MIDYLKGHVAHLENTYVVIDVHGVGYRVFCANPYDFSSKGQEPVIIYIHYHVREDAVLLYGFGTRQEQELFRKLIEVSGIGPRVAIGIMSGSRAEALAQAIRGEDIAFLTRLPGVGKKTAQRMILDLKDKMDGFTAGIMATDAKNAMTSVSYGDGRKYADVWNEAREALRALGYTEAELTGIWPRLSERLTDDDNVESIMKKALQLLYTSS